MKTKPAQELPIIPEIIADQLTRDARLVEALAARFTYHWNTNPGFRKSFARRDERDQAKVWMRHWMHDAVNTLRYLGKTHAQKHLHSANP